MSVHVKCPIEAAEVKAMGLEFRAGVLLGSGAGSHERMSTHTHC